MRSDLLSFLIEYSRGYEKWQLDLIEIVKDENPKDSKDSEDSEDSKDQK